MIALLLDEMFPPAAARILRDKHGLDAVHVSEVGLQAVDDTTVASAARNDGRVVVTENVADFAAERDVVLVFVLKANLPDGGAQAPALATALADWAAATPEPYIGHHWLAT